ncbi:chorismate mutase [Alteromonadaceae bacterium M269]|nr:chorismate mutase [Alteromonadaceae bacterium M269]
MSLVRYTYLLLTLISLFIAPMSLAKNISANQVFTLINQRLSHMENVAKHKLQAQLAIEDKTREKVVIDKAVLSAQALGFETQSIAEFFNVQIQVAKAIQHRVSADLMHQPTLNDFPDLHTQIRPELIRLSGAINMALAQYLSHQHFNEGQRIVFAQSLDNPYLSARDKDVLFDALLNIKMKQR